MGFGVSQPFQGQLPDNAMGPVELTRNIQIASGNASSSGTEILGTYFGIRTEKVIIAEAGTAAQIVTTTHEFFFNLGMPAKEGDILRWLTDNTTYRVTKVFKYPIKLCLWAEYYAAR
jgi:hypothetical protein